ncbi:MAG: enoyl-CoA hydratase/isomerase family protein [Pirellulales bacterium]|nr:enoyl-CoA hydratase/isomerase family protein [Pirellulales bacterium]
MIHEEMRESIAVLQMVRGRGNSLSSDFLTALIEMLDRFEQGSASAAVLTGKAGIFSAGVDLPTLLEGGPQASERFLELLVHYFHRLAVCPKPIVAAVNGHAIAGGCITMFACDYTVAAEGNYKLGVTELLVGVPFPAWPLEIVRHRVPPNQFRALCYTGMTVPPADALQRGMVDEVVPLAQVMDRALAVARQLAEVPAATFAITKQQMRQPLLDAVASTTRYFEDTAIGLWLEPEIRAAIERFVARTIRRA